ncbi:hypothetical protein YC2023_017820 [Brassica napus]
MASSVEAGSAGSVHALMVSDGRRPEASSIHHGLSVGCSLRRFDLVVCWRGRKVAVKPGVFTGIWMHASTARLAYCRYWKAGWRHSQGRMAVRCTEGIEGCRAEYVLTGLGMINDWFWNASKAGVLSILDGWLETKPSLFVHGHVGMDEDNMGEVYGWTGGQLAPRQNSRLHRFFFSFVSSSVLIKTSSSESTSFILGMNGLKRKRPFTGGGVSSRTRTRKAVSNRNEPVREESNPVRGMTVVSLSLDTESEGMSVVSSKEKASVVALCWKRCLILCRAAPRKWMITLEPYQVFPAWDGHEVDLSTCIIIKFQRS